MGRAVAFPAVAAALLVLAWIIGKAGGIVLVSAIMIAAAPVTILWMAEQVSFRGSEVAGRAAILFGRVIPNGSPEAATLVNRNWLATNLSPWIPGPDFVYLAVSAIIPLVSCIGLPPMMTVTFLGGLLLTMPDLQLNPSILGLDLLVGWALNLTGSPWRHVTAALTGGRHSGHRAFLELERSVHGDFLAGGGGRHAGRRPLALDWAVVLAIARPEPDCSEFGESEELPVSLQQRDALCLSDARQPGNTALRYALYAALPMTTRPLESPQIAAP